MKAKAAEKPPNVAAALARAKWRSGGAATANAREAKAGEGGDDEEGQEAKGERVMKKDGREC